MMPDKLLISPSLITLDHLCLAEQINILERLGMPMLHVDILDGHFSPSMPLGLETVRQLRQLTKLPFDVHLMAQNHEFFISELLDIGVEQLLFHVESEAHVDRQLQRVKAAGVACGLALKPSTPLAVLDYVLPYCDTVLLMLINPGYASHAGEGQLPYAEQKIRDLRARIDAQGLQTKIAIDGRVSRENMRAYHDGLVDIFVAGSTCLDKRRLEETGRDLMAFREEILGGE